MRIIRMNLAFDKSTDADMMWKTIESLTSSTKFVKFGEHNNIVEMIESYHDTQNPPKPSVVLKRIDK